MSWTPLALLEAFAGSVAVYEPDGTFVYVNAATERLFGAPRAELVGKRIWALFPDAVGNPFHAAFERVRASGVTETFEHHYAPFGEWFHNHVSLIDGRIHVVATSITQQKRAEERLALLARAARAFAAAADLEAVFSEIVVLLADGIGDGCVVRVRDTPTSPLRLAALHHRDPVTRARHRAFFDRPLGENDGVTVGVLHTGRSLLIERVDPAALGAAFSDDDHRAAAADAGVHSALAVPLQHGQRRLGIVSMTRDQTPLPFTAADLSLVEDIADRAAMAMVRLAAIETAEAGRRQASALAAASQSFAMARRDTTAVLEALATAAAQALDGGAIASALSDDASRIDAFGVHHKDPDVARVLTASLRKGLPVAGTLTERLLQAPGPLRVDPATLSAYAVVPAALPPTPALTPTAFLMVPVLISGRPLGTVSVVRFGGAPLSTNDERLLVELADRAALAIENVRVIEAERDAREAAERAAVRANRTHLLARLLSQAVTRHDVARAIVDSAGDGLGAGTAFVWFLSADGERLELATAGEIAPPLLAQYKTIPRTAHIPVNDAIDRHRVISLENGRIRALEYPATGDGAGSGFKAWAAIPLVHGDLVFGAFSVSFVDERSFSADDEAFFFGIGQQCTQALVRTTLFEAEREARARAERAEQNARAADRRKDEFLALLGHELRNPLAPIVTALELLQQKNVAGIEREREVLERQTKHLGRLVDDLLDISRITRGQLDLRQQARVDVADVVREAVEMASPMLEQRRQRLGADVAAGRFFVDGDRQRLVQVFQNLLVNASKYTPEGGAIDVSARVDGDRVVVDVVDDGAGIEPALLGALFEPFVQGTRTLESSRGGLGVGLTIVKRLVELHGGAVAAHSAGRGQGSRFTIVLPAAAAAASAAAAPSSVPRPATPKRVLLVDDNEDAAVLLAAALSREGHRVAIAHDGPKALDIARQHAPEVGVLDIGLPVMDGYELAQRLRALLPSLRLVAVTGYGQESDKARAAAAGFDRHLVKPVDLPALLDALNEPG